METKYQKIIFNIKNVIIGLLSIALLVSVYANLHINFSYNWKVKKYDYFVLDVSPINHTLSKKEIKELVDDLYDFKYIYTEWSLSRKGADGGAIIGARLVTISPSLPIKDYGITLAHELTHLKYTTNNETFVHYKAITTLYESNNSYLQQLALNEAAKVFRGEYKNKDGDCGYYLSEYFKNNNII